jgi:hypothetical protein
VEHVGGPHLLDDRVHRAAVDQVALVQRDAVAQVDEARRIHRGHGARQRVHVDVTVDEATDET